MMYIKWIASLRITMCSVMVRILCYHHYARLHLHHYGEYGETWTPFYNT